MSSNHRDINVSQFIANLNSLDPMDSINNNGVGIVHNDEELSIFSNTNFFDFDVGRSTNIAATVDDLLMQQERQLQDPKGKFAHHAESSSSGGAGSSSSPAGVSGSEVQMIPLDFSSLQQFSLASELSLSNGGHNSGASTEQQTNGNSNSNLKPIFNADKHEPPKRSVQLEDLSFNSSNKRARKNTLSSVASSSAASSPSLEPVSGDGENSGEGKASAEEDKRRRNTAASARFRIKKKLREQEMERTSKELQTKIQSLENQVMQLEMENRWLKNLVVEKNEARDLSELLDMKKKVLGGDSIKTE